MLGSFLEEVFRVLETVLIKGVVVGKLFRGKGFRSAMKRSEFSNFGGLRASILG